MASKHVLLHKIESVRLREGGDTAFYKKLNRKKKLEQDFAGPVTKKCAKLAFELNTVCKQYEKIEPSSKLEAEILLGELLKTVDDCLNATLDRVDHVDAGVLGAIFIARSIEFDP